jgi:hypothetical protein
MINGIVKVLRRKESEKPAAFRVFLTQNEIFAINPVVVRSQKVVRVRKKRLFEL